MRRTRSWIVIGVVSLLVGVSSNVRSKERLEHLANIDTVKNHLIVSCQRAKATCTSFLTELEKDEELIARLSYLIQQSPGIVVVVDRHEFARTLVYKEKSLSVRDLPKFSLDDVIVSIYLDGREIAPLIEPEGLIIPVFGAFAADKQRLETFLKEKK